jgi:hypothetical protein
MLREFIGERKTGLLFCSRTGKPPQQSNILRRWLHPVLKQLNWKDPESGCTTTGRHAFRRFRNTHLRNFTSTPPSLIKFWLGRAGRPTLAYPASSTMRSGNIPSTMISPS